MRFGIDGGCWSNRRGYGRFLRELLAAVARDPQGHEFLVFLDSATAPSFALGEPFKAVAVETRAAVEDGAVVDGSRAIGDVLRMSAAAARQSLDAFFFPSVYSYFPVLRPAPVLLGIHDVIVDRNPQFGFTSARNRLFWNAKVRVALAQADRIVTVSEYSREAIAGHFRIPATDIVVLPEAASALFYPDPPEEAEPLYVLAVGGISPNKNLPALVRAFGRIAGQWPGLRLVLAGDPQASGFLSSFAELQALIAKLGLGERVDFPGHVSDAQLRRLYSGTAVFAMISLDEGFGLPAVEAMACGAPVVASDAHALREVVGGAGLLVNPTDEAAAAAAIGRILGEPDLAAELRRRSLARAAEFSWDRAARLLISYLELTARGKR